MTITLGTKECYKDAQKRRNLAGVYGVNMGTLSSELFKALKVPAVYLANTDDMRSVTFIGNLHVGRPTVAEEPVHSPRWGRVAIDADGAIAYFGVAKPEEKE